MSAFSFLPAVSSSPRSFLFPPFSASATTCPSTSIPLTIIPQNPSLSFFSSVLHSAESRKPKTPIWVSSQRASLQTHERNWEDPDDGSGSDYDDEEEDSQVHSWELESDYEEEEGEGEEEGKRGAALASDSSVKTAATQYEEELLKEVEMLLEPEEKAILQQNEAPDLSKISTHKWSPFHTLAQSLQIPLMDKLLEYGFDIDALDKDGFTALHKAVIGKKEAVISHLLRKGANPHVRDKDGATPLHYAVQVGAMQTVKLLIKYKVDVNATDDEGWTPLHVAIQSRCRDIAKVLLVNGADKTRRNKYPSDSLQLDGKTPMDLSLCFGKDFKSYELSKLLKLVPANRDP